LLELSGEVRDLFNHRLENSPGFLVFLRWYLLSFNAGYINVGGLLAAGRFVSHVTGFATLFGADLAHGDWDAAIGILSVPLAFLVGSTIAGLLIDRPIYLGKKPHYDYVMFASAICLLISALIGHFDTLPQFGSNFHLKQIYLLLVLLCLASGLQNAAITSSSGSSVRTTHLTGITTDLGLGIAKWLTLKGNDPTIKKVNEANLLRVGTILSFAVGSAVGAIGFTRWGYLGFLLPAAISLYSALHGRYEKLTHTRFT
jgi:uncharacterized membrane protein YoaK (UPF0700 family)